MQVSPERILLCCKSKRIRSGLPVRQLRASPRGLLKPEPLWGRSLQDRAFGRPAVDGAPPEDRGKKLLRSIREVDHRRPDPTAQPGSDGDRARNRSGIPFVRAAPRPERTRSVRLVGPVQDFGRGRSDRQGVGGAPTHRVRMGPTERTDLARRHRQAAIGSGTERWEGIGTLRGDPSDRAK